MVGSRCIVFGVGVVIVVVFVGKCVLFVVFVG